MEWRLCELYVCRDGINVVSFFSFLLSLLVPILLCRLFFIIIIIHCLELGK